VKGRDVNSYATVLGLALLGSYLCSGCGPSQEAQEEKTLPPAEPVKQDVKKPDMEFEMRTDTVDAVRKKAEPGAVQADSTNWIIQYTVQVGAFKDPQNASLAQAKAKTRLQLPVTNEYDQKTGLYQIRVGSFARREEAAAFRQKLQRDYPGEYNDSWIAEVRKPK
jgi:cell division protein FtsN